MLPHRTSTALGTATQLIQGISDRKTRASFHKDWFPTPRIMIPYKHSSHDIHGIFMSFSALCFLSAQGTLVLTGCEPEQLHADGTVCVCAGMQHGNDFVL